MSAPEPTVAAVVVLAAGEGTRMKSATAKVLHELGGRTMLGHVLAAVHALSPEDVAVVTGHRREAVEEHLARIAPQATAVFQPTQDGTAHAVRLALEALEANRAATGRPRLQGTVVVVPGDTPLLSAGSVVSLAAHRATTGASAVVLTAHVPDPTGYGRVVRDRWGRVKAIIEHADADEGQRRISEVNSGVYAFDVDKLREALAQVKADNVQGEEYLPDVVSILVRSDSAVGAAVTDDPQEIVGVNDRAQLAHARALLRDRLVGRHLRDGVTFFDPATTWLDVTVAIEPDAEIWPNTILTGSTTVARGARVGPNCHLHDTTVGEGAVVRDATCDGAEIGPQATVGPYTYLRPGSRLMRGAKAGGFVEMKNATVGAESKVPHLSYVGDATIGERTNIGAATVFVNYDGVNKHHSTVGDDVRIGSDNMLVAPVTIGDGAASGAGTVIREDVPPGALAVSMGPQRNIEGWVEKRRAGTDAARTAARARAQASAQASAADESAPGDNGTTSDSKPSSGDSTEGRHA